MISLQTLTEAEIIERILAGEKSLYEIIVRRFNPYLYKIGRSYNYSHDDTLDLMQESFIDAYKNLSQFRGHSGFKAWLIRIMLNNCYRRREKSSYKNEMPQSLTENAQPMFTPSYPNPHSLIQNRELKHIMEDALGKLPEDYRLVFSLREINGFNVAEAASLLNISESNVKVRLNRAKTMLRKEIEKKYSATELFEFNLIYCDAMVERVIHAINQL